MSRLKLRTACSHRAATLIAAYARIPLIVVVSLFAISIVVVAVALLSGLTVKDPDGQRASSGASSSPRKGFASIEDRVATSKRFEQQYFWLTVEDGKAAAFLSEEAKAAFNSTRVGIQSLDTKAGTLIGIAATGIVAAGLGAISQLGDSSEIRPDAFPIRRPSPACNCVVRRSLSSAVPRDPRPDAQQLRASEHRCGQR
jgi:hypothetical protein